MPSRTVLTSIALLVLFWRGQSAPTDAEMDKKTDTIWHWSVQDYPNPRDPRSLSNCKQTQVSTICDPDEILTSSERTVLEDLIKRIQNDSPCLCADGCEHDADTKGVIIGIALMKAMQHSYHANLDAVAHEFSKALVNNWALGSCENGLLIFLSTENKETHFETGDVLKEFIHEDTIFEVLQQSQDHLEKREYYQGLQTFLSSMYNKIKEKHLASGASEDDENATEGSIGLTVGLVIGFAFLAGLVAAALVLVHRRKRNQGQDKFMYDSSRPGSRNSKRDTSGPIVKVPVVFPGAVYQPCSSEDGVKTRGEDEDDEVDTEDQYLRTLEENPAYEAGDTLRASNPAPSAAAQRYPENGDPVAVHQQRHSPDKPARQEHRDAYT